jgi:hypothetical protein
MEQIDAFTYQAMPAITFKCPITSQHVSGWYADEPRNNEDRPESVTCVACRRVHVVHPKTGKVIGFETKR